MLKMTRRVQFGNIATVFNFNVIIRRLKLL